MSSLLKSRKFWLAVVGVIQTVVLHYVEVPQDIWIAIDLLIGVVIAGIAIEDAAEKSARVYYVEDVEE
jgi:arginine exporter protein ArgO